MTVADDRLYTTRWVHVFEEDTSEGAVYRPEDDEIPLSRRPRERLELSADGTAKVITQGADDRLVEKPATWTSETRESAKAKSATPRRGRGKEAAPAPDPAASSADFRIVKESPSRLIVRRGAKS